MKCEYDCNQEANHQLKNGKWCCETTTKKCPEIIRKSAEGRRGAKRTKEQIINISKGHIGQISEKKGLNYEELYGNKANKIKRKMRNAKLLSKNINKIKQKFPFLYSVENFKADDSDNVYIKCKNSSCKKWFIPTYSQIYERHRALNTPVGFEENNFYCSEECKKSCVLYGSSASSLLSNSELQILNEFVMKRENGLCEYCGEPATIVHHTRPKKLEPFFALDPDYAITVCKKCHYKYGHKKGTECSTGNLSATICSE